MKTKTLLGALAIIGLLAVPAGAQITVSTAVANNLVEPYNTVQDTNANIYISDSVNNRIAMVDAHTNVTTLAGVLGVSGFNDGPPSGFNPALFNDPQGLLIVNLAGNHGLLVTDSGNNLIRFVNLANGNVVTLAGNTNTPTVAVNAAGTNASFNQPIGMDQDTNGNVYIADEMNNTIRVMNLKDHAFGVTNLVVTGTTFHHPTAVAFAGTNQLWVADSYNNSIKLITLATPTTGTLTTYVGSNAHTQSPSFKDDPFGPNARFNLPSGLLWINGLGLLISDTGNNSIRLATNYPAYGPANYAVSTFAGTPGTSGFANGNASSATFWSPEGLCLDPIYGAFLVADLKNNAIRRVTTGLPPPPPGAPIILTVTTSYALVNLTWSTVATATNYNVKRSTTTNSESIIGSTTSTNYTDTNLLDGIIYYYVVSAANVSGEGQDSAEVSAMPLFSPAPTNLTVTATNYGLISLAWSPSAGATSYNLKRSPAHGGPYKFVANVPSPTNSDTTVINGNTYYYVVTAVNAGGENPTNSPEVSATPPLPPVPDPQIGWVSFPPPSFSSVFNAGSQAGQTFNNDVPIVIIGDAGSETFYTYTNTPAVTNVPNPTRDSFSAPVGFADGDDPTPYVVAPVLPDLAIKAIGIESNHPNSAVVSALFRFVVANPSVLGTNAAQFTITNFTAGAYMYYTTDGSDPTNDGSGSSIGPVSVGKTLSLNFGSGTNLLMKIRAYKANYHSSAIISNLFLLSDYNPNAISFGFASGEASSEFVASPGQIFYAPVTLTTLPGTVVYSLQFNLTVNTGTTNPGPALASPPAPFNFRSMLMKPIPGTSLFIPIPPEMFVSGTGFTNLMFTNLTQNLLGVGWVERAGNTNLYNTLSQTLLTYSIAHDDMFPNATQPNEIIVGGYAFQVPANAMPGQTYQIQIGRPTATSDGIGAPGSSVFILAPTNGSLGKGAINAVKNVTLGNRHYIAGNSYPFRWFNAGDFGNTNLQNADVEQVFQSAIYSLNYPPIGSDFFDAMDSCGVTYVDLGHGYLEPDSTITDPNALSALFDGNDATINQIAFGDGVLDVCDVYVTYRRSLDTNLVWFARFWTNDVAHGVSGRVAQIVPNLFIAGAGQMASSGTFQPLVTKSLAVSITNTPSVNFTAGDYQATAGQVVQIPISAAVFGNYPLRLAMLNISVVPLDGSPALTTAVSFTPAGTNTALGTPSSVYTTSSGNGNYATTWLDNTIPGISNNATIGTLNVTLPATANSLSAYAIHFDHASGSPNGLASLPKKTMTGLITLSSRTTSSYGDGIPDSWRLRYFGTTNNLLSVSNACPSGDGVNNWKKYVAGLDPTDPASKLSAGLDQLMAQSAQDSVIYWPSVSGKQYIVQRAASLFPAAWKNIVTNTGTGGYMEFHDSPTNKFRFYRVSVQ